MILIGPFGGRFSRTSSGETKEDTMTKELGRIRAARAKAQGKKGKYFGHLARRRPSDPDAKIFWNAAMLVVNPHKAKLGDLMFLGDADRAFSEACKEYVENLHSEERQALDLDRLELERMGVWR